MTTTTDFVRPVSTRQDRQERMQQLSHRFGTKTHKQRRSNDRRKAITESREAA